MLVVKYPRVLENKEPLPSVEGEKDYYLYLLSDLPTLNKNPGLFAIFCSERWLSNIEMEGTIQLTWKTEHALVFETVEDAHMFVKLNNEYLSWRVALRYEVK